MRPLVAALLGALVAALLWCAAARPAVLGRFHAAPAASAPRACAAPLHVWRDAPRRSDTASSVPGGNAWGHDHRD